jgi:cytochrome P450
VRRALGEDRVVTRLEQLEQLAVRRGLRARDHAAEAGGAHAGAAGRARHRAGGVAIPKGTLCIFLMRAGTSDARHFAVPELRAGRWLRRGGRAGQARRMPFGAGPRMCPGRYLALLEIKMACDAARRASAWDSVEAPTAARCRSACPSPWRHAAVMRLLSPR